MSFWQYPHRRRTVGHGVHQLVHGAAGGHGGVTPTIFGFSFASSTSVSPNTSWKSGGRLLVSCLEAFSGFRIELPGACQISGFFSAGSNPFLYSVQMQYFRSLHIFDVPQDTGYVFHIVSIDRDRSSGCSSLQRYSAAGRPLISDCWRRESALCGGPVQKSHFE